MIYQNIRQLALEMFDVFLMLSQAKHRIVSAGGGKSKTMYAKLSGRLIYRGAQLSASWLLQRH